MYYLTVLAYIILYVYIKVRSYNIVDGLCLQHQSKNIFHHHSAIAVHVSAFYNVLIQH